MRNWTDEDLARIEERDTLCWRKIRGEPLTDAELARLDELEAWLDSIEPAAPGLPPEVKALVEEVLAKGGRHGEG